MEVDTRMETLTPTYLVDTYFEWLPQDVLELIDDEVVRLVLREQLLFFTKHCQGKDTGSCISLVDITPVSIRNISLQLGMKRQWDEGISQS